MGSVRDRGRRRGREGGDGGGPGRQPAGEDHQKERGSQDPPDALGRKGDVCGERGRDEDPGGSGRGKDPLEQLRKRKLVTSWSRISANSSYALSFECSLSFQLFGPE